MKPHTMRTALGLFGCLLAGCSTSLEPVEIITAPEDATWDDLPPVEPGEGDWPWWRGPTSDGKAAEGQNPPRRWSETENVVWKAKVPGRGHGSPSIWGRRIFLPTAEDDAEVQSLLCYHRETGEQLWKTEIHRGGFMHRHDKNSHASSTPACDGQRVFTAFMVQGGIWITAVDLDGNILWQKKLAGFRSVHGYAASPLIYRSLVIVSADNPGSSFMTALHRRSGKIIWQIRRTNYQNFAGPIVANVCGRDQLLITGPYKVSSYDPGTGDPLWTCEGPTDVAASTIVWGEDVIYASAGYPEKNLLCIRADGHGDVTDTHVVWQVSRKSAAYVPSLLVHAGLLYMVNDGGVLKCFEAETGKVLWRQQLPGGFSSSPVLAGEHIYAVNEDGLLVVFRPGREFRLVAENDLGDGGFATPAICGDRIYLRTLRYLYCLGKSGGDIVIGNARPTRDDRTK